MTPTSDAERHLPLKPEVLEILFSLLDGERHGYAIIKDVEARTQGGLVLRPGALYRHLHRMLQDGLLVESERRPAPEQDDERRRYYDVTPLGRRVVAAELRRMEAAVAEGRARKRLLGEAKGGAS
jgi:DNA-binding PadR family transcriptional regulator